ncbi:tripartite tricarboxylate transporter TctB family protein [Bradyrhizobium sp. SYSU BS000235]|uniref:tripartite tricarboxylate transporter TctB family protein n=1 Tax=Bradyrhizobium sp. SYSU BS000235 TaxID=3411332 RepID=UPI003C761A58
MIITDRNRDYYAGALMAMIGAGTAYQGSQYGIGSLAAMESGFFPTVLGVLLVLVGAAIAATNGKAGEATIGLENAQHGAPAAVDWRSWIAIIAGVCLFMACSEYLGLLPAIFSCVFVSAIGSRATSWKQAFALAIGVTVFGVLLFGYGLQVQIPILRGF